MDYEKYYDRRGDGSYVIHFPNNKGLTMKEVNTIFSSFGKVLSADDRGQPNGLCFVKLETAEDAKQCIEAFKNHKFIKILPHITKKFVNVKRKSYNENKKTFKQNFTVNNSDNNIKNNNNINNNDLFAKKIQEKCNQSDSNISESISIKDNFNSDIKIEENKKSTSISSLRHFLKLKNLRRVVSSTSISSEATNENLNRLEEIPFNETEIPSLVSIDKKYKSPNIKVPSSSTKVIPAQEVIVANIHPNISIHYILHLFEKYNPISVSLMMTAPNTRILYCHVYFKTYEEAYSTMKEFDKYSLHGKYLIVLTSEKLIEEAL
ncbi:putative uncharacterized protein DDB_G0292292 [Apis cerana]|uniref:putative uncharacterized protein DDB_G0292292 n=1 Tax=Apis cerana TaxID=7461 RepID=UPI0007E2DCBB|nr:putative uncharacterized protein DDB_G0292292 [Apis cerana]